MRDNQSSVTAVGIAIARAVESEKPADERRRSCGNAISGASKMSAETN
jgi:hypothetical protein